MNKTHFKVFLFLTFLICVAGAVHAADTSNVSNIVNNGNNAAMSKLSAIQNKTQEIANGTLDWSVILFDVLIAAIMTTISSMPILNDPSTSTAIQAVAAIAFTWEFMIIIRDLQKGEFDSKAFGAMILNIGFMLCLYGVHDYRNMIPGTQSLWAKADSVSLGDNSVKTLDKDLFNIVKYFGSQVSAGFKPNGQDVFRIISLAQSESVIKKYCEKENFPNLLECRKDLFTKYENEGGALTSKGKEAVLNLIHQRDFSGTSIMDIPTQISYFLYTYTFSSSFLELMRMFMAIIVTIINVIGVVFANVVMLGSLLEASMMLIILKIIYPFMIVRTLRARVQNILRAWLGFALVGMVCTMCSFVTDMMLSTAMNILTGTTTSPAINLILIGVLASPLAFGFVAVVKVIIFSVLALKISLLKNVAKIAKGLMSLQFDGLANLASGALQATMGMVITGASLVTSGASSLTLGKGLLNGFKGDNLNHSSDDARSNSEIKSETSNLADNESVQDVNVKNPHDIGREEVKTKASNTTINPRNRITLPETDENGRIKRSKN